MKRIHIILLLAVLSLISLVFDNYIPNSFGFENILNDSFLWAIFILGVIISFFIYIKKEEKIPFLFSGVLISSIITGMLKFVIKRPRPFIGLAEVLKIGYSFPSGHATVAFAVLPFLESKFKWIWLIFIIIILIMRIYSGVHYLSDVIFGALIGYSVSSLIIYLKK